MNCIRTEPIDGASAWTGEELKLDRRWEYPLDDADRVELDGALARVKDTPLEKITRDAFPLPRLSRRIAALSGDLRYGRGFALLRGFPTKGYVYKDIERMYWGFCTHIGQGLTQNGEASFIHYVTDGKLRPEQGRRGVGFPRESKLHIDLTDVVSLLCVRQAPDDPPSRVSSSMTLYNQILRSRPDALVRLYEGFEWDRMDEHGPGETPTSGYKVPVFSQKDNIVSCQYNRNWINNAAKRNGAPLTEEENAIFDLMDKISAETCFEFPFQTGDIQFCNNYNCFHGRAAHAIVDEEERKRVLMRIWLDMENPRAFADEAIIRCGNSRHGQMGWTPAEMLSGANTEPRARRADGAIKI